MNKRFEQLIGKMNAWFVQAGRRFEQMEQL